MRCFNQDFNLNVHSYLDLFRMGVVYHLTTIRGINNVTTSYWVENLHLMYKSMHEFEWYRVTSWTELAELWKGLKVFWYCSYKMAQKYLWKSSIFRNVTGCNSFSKVSLYFKKMTDLSKRVLQTYSENAFFVWYNKLAEIISQWRVLLKRWGNLWKMSWIKFIL